MFVMTIDQRSSRTSTDKVPELLELLNSVSAVRSFERSVGDEVQGIVDNSAQVVELAMLAIRNGPWYVGIGVGEVNEPLPASPREAAGEAFIYAREAVENAKRHRDQAPIAVIARDQRLAAAAQAVLVLVGDVIAARSAAEWRILDLWDGGKSIKQSQVAQKLGISPQAVSKAIARAAWQQEQAGRLAAELLLGQIHP